MSGEELKWCQLTHNQLMNPLGQAVQQNYCAFCDKSTKFCTEVANSIINKLDIELSQSLYRLDEVLLK